MVYMILKDTDKLNVSILNGLDDMDKINKTSTNFSSQIK